MSPRYSAKDPYWIRIAKENEEEDLRLAVEEIENERAAIRNGEPIPQRRAGIFFHCGGKR